MESCGSVRCIVDENISVRVNEAFLSLSDGTVWCPPNDVVLKAGLVFGWIMVAHQIGASTASYGAGIMREWMGSYSVPFVTAGFLCLFASLMAIRIMKSGKHARVIEAKA